MKAPSPLSEKSPGQDYSSAHAPTCKVMDGHRVSDNNMQQNCGYSFQIVCLFACVLRPFNSEVI